MIGAIEQAIVDRIAAASAAGALGYSLRAVASYGGELDAVAGTVRDNPAVWAVYAGERAPEQLGPTAWRREATFTVFVTVQNRRNDGAQRLGDGARPGTYQLLADCFGLLAGQSLGLDMEGLRPGAVRSLQQDVERSVYAIEFTARFVSEMAADELSDFAHFHADWDVPPHGNVTPPLPAATPDAQDDVYLEIAT